MQCEKVTGTFSLHTNDSVLMFPANNAKQPLET